MVTRTRQRTVQVAVPALIVGALMFAALWRVSVPSQRATDTTVAAARPAVSLPALTETADLLAADAVGRRASLENVPIRAVPSARTLWVGTSDPGRLFVVLDPDVKRSHEARVVEGARVTLIGLVRQSPAPEVAIRQWSVDPDTAQTVRDGGTYLHVTEIRPAS